MSEPTQAVGAPLERHVRPAVPKRGLVERLRAGCTDWDGSQMAAETQPMECLTAGDAREAADELMRLQGQMETLGRWIVEALKVLDTIDPDDMEESEQLLALIKGGEMLSMSALAPQMWAMARKNAGKGPTCNMLRPWEQAD
jgi:hypothetical protein